LRCQIKTKCHACTWFFRVNIFTGSANFSISGKAFGALVQGLVYIGVCFAIYIRVYLIDVAGKAGGGKVNSASNKLKNPARGRAGFFDEKVQL
jgi:hypothetical protein